MKITLHGARSASFHTNSGRPVPSGIRNSARLAITAMVPSVHDPAGSSGATSGCVTHPMKVTNTSGTSRFSGAAHAA